MDLKAVLGNQFDPEAKYELYDAALLAQGAYGEAPGRRITEVPDPNNRRTLIVFDTRGAVRPAPATPVVAPAPAAPAPAEPAPPKRGFSRSTPSVPKED